MGNANLNIIVVDRRMLSPREAAEYCGLPLKRFPITCSVPPIEMPGGRKRYDKRDLDIWIENLKSGESYSDDDILERLP